jgi:prolyl 4-hydroxylase
MESIRSGADASLDFWDVRSLDTAARQGKTAAMVALGKRLLVGRDAPFEPERGADLIQRASQSEDPDGLCMAATLYGAGAWVPHSWSQALDHLVLAAERGSADAAEQLTIIALRKSYDGQPVPPDHWRRLRAGIDLERSIQPPPPRQISDAPRVWSIPGFASAATCNRLIRRSRNKLRPAKMYNRHTKNESYSSNRNNSDFIFDLAESGVVLLLLRVRISLVVSLPVLYMEPPQILHYAPGQELGAHFDFVLNETDAQTKKGDRAATFLLYLNDEFEGGETDFLKTGLRVRGKRGDALFFANLRDGKPDRDSLHAGRPVTRGEKWLFSQWIRNAPYATAVASRHLDS